LKVLNEAFEASNEPFKTSDVAFKSWWIDPEATGEGRQSGEGRKIGAYREASMSERVAPVPSTCPPPEGLLFLILDFNYSLN
jgi:hypothetical protein